MYIDDVARVKNADKFQIEQLREDFERERIN